MSLEGIDTSKWQGAADWAGAARVTGFAIPKATQGVSEVDVNYAATLAAFRAAGRPVGSYHYADGGDPIAEAAYYVAHNARANGELQVLDFEGVVLAAADPVGWAVTWCEHVLQLTGNLPLIYMNGNTLHSYDWSRLVKLNVGLWLATWGPTKPADPGQWPFIIMWQHTDSERVAGIPANVDGDTFYGDANVWTQYGANRGAPSPHPPAPVPVPPVHSPAPAPGGGRTYTVVAGDQLLRIASRFSVSEQALIAANEARYPSLVHNPNLIQVGWELTIPGHATPAPSGAQYVNVAPGDSLSSIAAAHGLQLARIEQLNPQCAPNWDHIEPGDRIRIR